MFKAQRVIGFGILCSMFAISLIGCTQQGMAKHWGGTATETLPPGQKLVCATWEEQNLWYVLRPMREGEVAETYTIHESSAWGVMQGNIIVHEVK